MYLYFVACFLQKRVQVELKECRQEGHVFRRSETNAQFRLMLTRIAGKPLFRQGTHSSRLRPCGPIEVHPVRLGVAGGIQIGAGHCVENADIREASLKTIRKIALAERCRAVDRQRSRNRSPWIRVSVLILTPGTSRPSCPLASDRQNRDQTSSLQ